MRSVSEHRVRVCAEAELDPAHPARTSVAGRAVLVVRDSDGTVHAIDDLCTHAAIPLSDGFVEDGVVECWAHGARFDLHSGAALALPASEPVRVYPVEVVDGDVFVLDTIDGPSF